MFRNRSSRQPHDFGASCADMITVELNINMLILTKGFAILPQVLVA
jgi:hypothetical protein